MGNIKCFLFSSCSKMNKWVAWLDLYPWRDLIWARCMYESRYLFENVGDVLHSFQPVIKPFNKLNRRMRRSTKIFVECRLYKKCEWGRYSGREGEDWGRHQRPFSRWKHPTEQVCVQTSTVALHWREERLENVPMKLL